MQISQLFNQPLYFNLISQIIFNGRSDWQQLTSDQKEVLLFLRADMIEEYETAFSTGKAYDKKELLRLLKIAVKTDHNPKLIAEELFDEFIWYIIKLINEDFRTYKQLYERQYISNPLQ